VGGLFLNSAERDIPQCRRSLTSKAHAGLGLERRAPRAPLNYQTIPG
jgi:hypothetical protein